MKKDSSGIFSRAGDGAGTHLIFVPILLVLFIACYYKELVWMYGRYMNTDSYYSHGFMVPFVTGYFIWLKKDELREVHFESSLLGLLLIVLALMMHITGTVLYVFSISGFSIFFLILGASLFLLGRDAVGRILFPLVFLIFMFPLPRAAINAVSFPMKMLVAKISVELIELMGIPIFREGFNITIPAGSLLVGNPCSGLRSLIAFLALGSVFAYLSDIPKPLKLLLFLLTVPIALLSNMIRVPILILISHHWGLEAAAPESVWHTASGVFVFAVGFVLLLLIGKLFEWKS